MDLDLMMDNQALLDPEAAGIVNPFTDNEENIEEPIELEGDPVGEVPEPERKEEEDEQTFGEDGTEMTEPEEDGILEDEDIPQEEPEVKLPEGVDLQTLVENYNQQKAVSDVDVNKLVNEVVQGQQEPPIVPQGLAQGNNPQPSGVSIPPELSSDSRFVALANSDPQLALQFLNTYKAQQFEQQRQQQALEEQQRELAYQREVLDLRAKDKDFAKLGGQIPKYIKENPWLLQSPEPIKAAYRLAKADYVVDQMSKNAEVMSKKMAAKAKEKMKAKTIMPGSNSAGQVEEVKTPEQLIQESILSAKF